MSDHMSGESKRRWEIWSQQLPDVGPLLQRMDGHELVIWGIPRELALRLVDKLSVQEKSNPAVRDNLPGFRTVVEGQPHHSIFVNFWPHKKPGFFGGGIWVACLELWVDEGKEGGANSAGFALGWIAAPTEPELAHRIHSYTEVDSMMTLASTGREAISVMKMQ